MVKLPNVFRPLAVSLALVAPACTAESPSDVAGTPRVGITESPSDLAGTPRVGSSNNGIIELGKISPNGSYRLWSAVNDVLLDYASLEGGDELRSQVQALTAYRFNGKSPADVLAQAAVFRDALEQLLERLQLPKVEVYEDPLGREATPGVVFVNAGNIMDALVAAFHSASNRSDESLGDLYDVPVATGKTPSDVFGLVFLATRRLQLIAAS